MLRRRNNNYKRRENSNRNHKRNKEWQEANTLYKQENYQNQWHQEYLTTDWNKFDIYNLVLITIKINIYNNYKR